MSVLEDLERLEELVRNLPKPTKYIVTDAMVGGTGIIIQESLFDTMVILHKDDYVMVRDAFYERVVRSRVPAMPWQEQPTSLVDNLRYQFLAKEVEKIDKAYLDFLSRATEERLRQEQDPPPTMPQDAL